MRDQTGLTLVEGLREVARAREAGLFFEEFYLCPELLEKFSGQSAVDQVRSWGRDIYEVSGSVFEKICFGDRKEGVVAVVRRPEAGLKSGGWDSNPRHPLFVVLDHVEKPGNLGAILRTSDGAGVDAVIVADTKTDIFSPNVIRASTGVVFSMNVMQGTPLQVKDFLKKNNIQIVAASPEGKQTYFLTDLKGPIAFVLGAEDQGLSDFWLKEADVRVFVPMRGKADSLNVSSTAAILAYEALRQKHLMAGR